jgi:DNA-binding MarR family transcriptional regulator
MATIADRAPAAAPDPIVPTTGGDVDPVARRVLDELSDALGAWRCGGSERLVRAGVSMSHLHVMWILQSHGDLSMTHLAEMLDISLSNATGLVDRMEERGVIDRIRVPDDRRIVLVSLSDHGRELLAQVDLVRSDLVATVLRHLDATQLAGLLHTLADLRQAMQAARTAGELPVFSADEHGHQRYHPQTA